MYYNIQYTITFWCVSMLPKTPISAYWRCMNHCHFTWLKQ